MPSSAAPATVTHSSHTSSPPSRPHRCRLTPPPAHARQLVADGLWRYCTPGPELAAFSWALRLGRRGAACYSYDTPPSLGRVDEEWEAAHARAGVAYLSVLWDPLTAAASAPRGFWDAFKRLPEVEGEPARAALQGERRPRGGCACVCAAAAPTRACGRSCVCACACLHACMLACLELRDRTAVGKQHS